MCSYSLYSETDLFSLLLSNNVGVRQILRTRGTRTDATSECEMVKGLQGATFLIAFEVSDGT